jgi:hypothetical protein
MPPFARVALVLAKYAWLGVIPQVIPSLESPPIPPTASRATRTPTSPTSGCWPSEAGYTFFMKPGPAPATSFAYWGPEVRMGEVQPALTVDSGFATNCEELSFSLRQGGHGDSHRLHPERRHQGADPDPDPVGDPVPPAARPRPAAAAEDRPPARDRPPFPLRGGGPRLRPCRAPFRRRAGPRQDRRAALRPGPARPQPVGVRGAGAAFDGVHYLETVRHELKRGSYIQSFTLKRSGLLPAEARVPA